MSEMEAWNWVKQQSCNIDIDPLTGTVILKMWKDGKAYKEIFYDKEVSFAFIECVKSIKKQVEA